MINKSFILLVSIISISGLPYNQDNVKDGDNPCLFVTPTSWYRSCTVDLVVGIDMSTAMGSESHIATLVDSILFDFLPLYDQSSTNTAVISFGASTIDSSNYYDNLQATCNYIHTAESQSIQLGMYAANLTKVFAAYRDNDFNKNRDYQQVFVLFTAVTDNNTIYAAQTITNQIRTAGAQIIVVVLNVDEIPTAYNNVADQVFNASGYSVFDVAINVSSASCINSGVTHTHPTTTNAPITNPSSNPLSNEIGSLCSTNTKNAWLDLVLIVDVSNAMSKTDLQRFGVQLATIFEAFTIGNTEYKAHNTRVAIITYATEVSVHLNFTEVSTFGDLFQYLMGMKNYFLPNDKGGNIQGGLQQAYTLLQEDKSFRIQGVILASAAYNPTEFNDPTQTAKTLKDDGISLFTISYSSPNGLLSTLLSNLSSPGYSYINTDQKIVDKITFGLTQINCVCPPRQLQFKIYNSVPKNYTVYADCLNGFAGDTDPLLASYACAPGILTSVTSLEKLDFIIDNVVVHDMKGVKNFTVGATQSNGQWSWQNYNETGFPFGSYPSINASTGNYGYFSNIYGFNWVFKGGPTGFENARPYICQTRACDADYFCDMNPTFLFQK